MRFVSTLSPTDIQELNEAYLYDEKPTLRRRAHAILLSNNEQTINQISKILSVGRDTWLR